MFTLHQTLEKCKLSKMSLDGRTIVTINNDTITIYKLIGDYFEIFQKIDLKDIECPPIFSTHRIRPLKRLMISSDGSCFVFNSDCYLGSGMLILFKQIGIYKQSKMFLNPNLKIDDRFSLITSANNNLTTIVANSTKGRKNKYSHLTNIFDRVSDDWQTTIIDHSVENAQKIKYDLNKKGNRLGIIIPILENRVIYSIYEKNNNVWEKKHETKNRKSYDEILLGEGDNLIIVPIKNNGHLTGLLKDKYGSVPLLDDRINFKRFLTESFLSPNKKLIIIKNVKDSKPIANTDVFYSVFIKKDNDWKLIDNSTELRFIAGNLPTSNEAGDLLLTDNKVFKVSY